MRAGGRGPVRGVGETEGRTFEFTRGVAFEAGVGDVGGAGVADGLATGLGVGVGAGVRRFVFKFVFML